MYNKEEILNFIKRFQNEGTIKAFTEGCCYYFAIILISRFCLNESDNLMYHPIDNHFAVKINKKLYDITGEIDDNGFEYWSDFLVKDELLTKRIFRDCIDF